MTVESLEQLKKICQKQNYRTNGNWMARHITRDMALPLTRLLLSTPVTANQISFLTMLTSVFSAFFLAGPGPKSFLVGACLWQFWYLLDHVDGQIARYRKSVAPEGLFLDFMMHHLANLILPFGVGAHLFFLTAEPLALFTGFASSVSLGMIAILNDCKAKAAVEYLTKDGRPAAAHTPVSSSGAGRSLPKKVFSMLHKSCEGHVVMNVISVFSIFYFFHPDIKSAVPALWFLTGYYGFVASVVWAYRLYYFVTSKQVTAYVSEVNSRLAGER